MKKTAHLCYVSQNAIGAERFSHQQRVQRLKKTATFFICLDFLNKKMACCPWWYFTVCLCHHYSRDHYKRVGDAKWHGSWYGHSRSATKITTGLKKGKMAWKAGNMDIFGHLVIYMEDIFLTKSLQAALVFLVSVQNKWNKKTIVPYESVIAWNGETFCHFDKSWPWSGPPPVEVDISHFFANHQKLNLIFFLFCCFTNENTWLIKDNNVESTCR